MLKKNKKILLIGILLVFLISNVFSVGFSTTFKPDEGAEIITYGNGLDSTSTSNNIKNRYAVFFHDNNGEIKLTFVNGNEPPGNIVHSIEITSDKEEKIIKTLYAKGAITNEAGDLKSIPEILKGYTKGDLDKINSKQLQILNDFYKSDSLNVEDPTKIIQKINDLDNIDCSSKSNSLLIKSCKTQDYKKQKEIYQEYLTKIKSENLLKYALDNSGNNAQVLQELRKRECAGSMFESICEAFKVQDTERYLKKQLAQETYKIKKELNEEIDKTCKDDEKICKKRKEYIEDYNKKLEKLKDTYCSEGNADCEKIVNQYVEEHKLHDANFLGYTLFTSILNPSQGSIELGKLFGFEPNYGRVPDFLRQSMSSRVCLSKIEGYLDDKRQNKNNGRQGITAYRQCDDENSASDKINCVENYLDLRGQMTEIMPNGKFYLTFSYYIKAPKTNGYKYLIGGSFIDKEGNKQKFMVKKPTELKLGKSESGYKTILLPTDISAEGGKDFMIGIIALNNGAVEIKEITPIIMISTSNRPDPLYETKVPSSSTSSSSSSSNQNPTPTRNESKLTETDLLSLL